MRTSNTNSLIFVPLRGSSPRWVTKPQSIAMQWIAVFYCGAMDCGIRFFGYLAQILNI